MKIYEVNIYDDSCPESVRSKYFTNKKDAEKCMKIEKKMLHPVYHEYCEINKLNIPTSPKAFCEWMEGLMILGI